MVQSAANADRPHGSTGQSWSKRLQEALQVWCSEPAPTTRCNNLFIQPHQPTQCPTCPAVCVPTAAETSQTHALPWNPVWVKRQRHQTARWVIHKSHTDSRGWRGRKVNKKTSLTKATCISQWPPDQVRNIYCTVWSESKGTKSKKTEKK